MLITALTSLQSPCQQESLGELSFESQAKLVIIALIVGVIALKIIDCAFDRPICGLPRLR